MLPKMKVTKMKVTKMKIGDPLPERNKRRARSRHLNNNGGGAWEGLPSAEEVLIIRATGKKGPPHFRSRLCGPRYSGSLPGSRAFQSRIGSKAVRAECSTC